MKPWLLLCAGAAALLSQPGPDAQPLSRAADFNPQQPLSSRQRERGSRSFLSASAEGVSVTVVSNGSATFTRMDPRGRVVSSLPHITSVNARIETALPRRDGGVWIVSSGPEGEAETFSGGPESGAALPPPRVTEPGHRRDTFIQLDLYSASGAREESDRLLVPAPNGGTFIGASDDALIIRDTGTIHSEPAQFLRFGSLKQSRFEERGRFRLSPPLHRVLGAIDPDGDLVLVDRDSGGFLELSLRTHSSASHRLSGARRIQGVAASKEAVFLLSDGQVLQVSRDGVLTARYSLPSGGSYQPVSLAAAPGRIYLADAAGRVEAFQVN